MTNAGASYCRLVSKLIEMLGVEGLLAYLDDLLLHTQEMITFGFASSYRVRD